jgi:hypothetical protein
MVHPSTPTPRLNMLWKDSFETPLRQVLMYLWKAACDRFNREKRRRKRRSREKSAEWAGTQRGSSPNHPFKPPSSSSW